MTRRAVKLALLAALLLATLVAAFLRRPPATEPLAPAHKVILLIAPGLSLAEATDAARAPALASAFASGAYGVFPTRTRADDAPHADPLPLAVRVLATGDRTPGPHAGTLAGVLRKAGVGLVALTDADTTTDELTERRAPNPLMIDEPAWRRPQAGFPDGYVTDPARFAAALCAAVPPAGGTALIVGTFDDLYRAELYAPLALPGATALQRAEALRRLDASLAALTAPDSPARLPAGTALVLVAPLPGEDGRARGERLGPILVWSPDGAGAGRLLTSPSTRSTPGLMASTDIAATVAGLLLSDGRARKIGAGRAARVIADDARLAARVAGWDAQARAQALLVDVPWALAAALLLAAWLAGIGQRRAGLSVASAAVAYPFGLIAFAALPMGFAWSVYVFAGFSSAAVAAVAQIATRRAGRPTALVGAISLATTLLVLADILTGGHLLARTPLSYSPMEAARFYGVGNEAAGLLVGAALSTGALVFAAEPVAAALLGLAVSLTVGLPMLGAKAGSLIGALIGFGALLLLARRGARRVRPAVIVAALGLLVALIAAYALWEATRAGDARTHVGEAVVAARMFGPRALLGIARRKAAMDLHLAVSSPWAVLLLAEALLCAFLYRRDHTRLDPPVRSGLVALFAAAAALLVLNDAGVVGAATCLLFAVPIALLPRLEDAPATGATPITND
jgi:hypothetical protein